MVPADLPLVWMDLEMTGLDVERERILEIAVLVTDGELNVVAEGPTLAIHQSEALLAGMDEWNTRTHTGSGLVDRVRESGLDEAAAEARVLDFLRSHVREGEAPLSGNSVHMDRAFLRRYMPRLEAFLHYRIVDVSTVKELVRRWYPEAFEARPPKRGNHRALDDIRESIDELRYYRRAVFEPRA
ncbi:MAG: oligoribonuclease [Myxococcota bacterium]